MTGRLLMAQPHTHRYTYIYVWYVYMYMYLLPAIVLVVNHAPFISVGILIAILLFFLLSLSLQHSLPSIAGHLLIGKMFHLISKACKSNRFKRQKEIRENRVEIQALIARVFGIKEDIKRGKTSKQN